MARRDGPISKACRNFLAYLAAHGLDGRDGKCGPLARTASAFDVARSISSSNRVVLLSGKIDQRHACENLVHKRLIVRTVVAFEQVIADAFFSVNLMQASSLRTDGILPATTKTPKVQNGEFQVFKVAGEITLRRQVGSAHSRERASDFCRQSMNILGIPYLILEGSGTGEDRRYLPEEAE